MRTISPRHTVTIPTTETAVRLLGDPELYRQRYAPAHLRDDLGTRNATNADFVELINRLYEAETRSAR